MVPAAMEPRRTAIQKANQRYTTQHRCQHPPGRLFHVGDRVYLSTRNINLKTDSKKLTPRFIGPYKITHRLNPVTFRLQLPASLRIHPVFHQSQLKHVFFSPLSPQVTAPPPVRIIDGGPAYTVRRILDWVIVIIVEFAVFAAPTVILLQIICARRAGRKNLQHQMK
ncbi:hypothetical protein ROHU_008553 [Labeo rohita]|uniref:Tf2-1-like SH3-like domain-containing protein n=1 Tax=Labeo rohita TaxID=84645 RepID=A0A498M5S5_LABRO|nr:hypothetical protein ROHU_008553 [Labeo rohita]